LISVLLKYRVSCDLSAMPTPTPTGPTFFERFLKGIFKISYHFEKIQSCSSSKMSWFSKDLGAQFIPFRYKKIIIRFVNSIVLDLLKEFRKIFPWDLIRFCTKIFFGLASRSWVNLYRDQIFFLTLIHTPINFAYLRSQLRFNI